MDKEQSEKLYQRFHEFPKDEFRFELGKSNPPTLEGLEDLRQALWLFIGARIEKAGKFPPIMTVDVKVEFE